MRFTVEGWDPDYDSGTLDLLAESDAQLDTGVETTQWAPQPPQPVEPPSAMLFVDGVRRIDARVWLEDAAGDASQAICASYASGVVCCCTGRAHLLTAAVRRGLFASDPVASDIATTAGTFAVSHTPVAPNEPAAQVLSQALQRRLADLEVVTAVDARTGDHPATEDDLLVVDGPLHGRDKLPRAVGFVKSHRTTYLPPELNATVSQLRTGERTPVFLVGTTWSRYTWYLRLPCEPGAPWAGIARLECSSDLTGGTAAALATLSQAALLRFASAEIKDPRAPQNLYPIGGLERELRRRLGDARVLYRALRSAAG